MGRIIAIGGGDINSGDTLEIDRVIVEATHLDHPKLLFIPTASNDAQAYVDSVKLAFGETLGCDVHVLRLIETAPSKEAIKAMIMSADIIYVGGGNTKMMIEVWRQHSVDDYLKEAYNKGVILSGLSAGAICWFDLGHSDSDTIASGEIKPYSLVEGIGLIPLLHCPHYNSEGRADDFSLKVRASGKIGLGLDNFTAIDLLDDRYRIIKTDQYANAYRVIPDEDDVTIEVIESGLDYQDLAQILTL